MEKKHELDFCPGCGAKLDGDEFICAECGYKLAELHPVQKTPEPVVIPQSPVVNETGVLTFCPGCGAKLEGSELFCNSCGMRLSEPTIDPPVEIPVVPTPPVIEAPVVPPPPPIVVEVPAPPPPTVEKVEIPVEPIVVNDSNLSFCPNCGSKISANETFCNECGFNLKEPNIAPPVVETPVTPPAYQNIPPVTQQPVYQQTPQFSNANVQGKKKGKGAGFWILIIFIIVVVLGGGTLAFLQYNGTVQIGFLSNIIPAKDSKTTADVTKDQTQYYVVHTFANLGSSEVAIISNVVASNQPSSSDAGAKNKFNIAIMQKFPNDYSAFANNIFVTHYSSYTEAVSGHAGLLKSYGTSSRHYAIRTVDFTY